MPVQNYGVLKGIVLEGRPERNADTPHYQIHMIVEEGMHYRIAVNVMSSSQQSEVLYMADENFNGTSLGALLALKPGYTKIDRGSSIPGLDYVRGKLFDPSLMKALPFDAAGPDDDLNDRLEAYIQKAKAEKAPVYIFGSRFGPENTTDKVFGFRPENGMHNVHMNQGNEDKPGNEKDWARDNGIYHDGGILIQFESHWTAVFLAFLSQSWCTDERGYPDGTCTHDQLLKNAGTP
ncbi:YukJ family protein [Bacillus sp. MUM 13]|uniref:YukJ family protein n=1 Tax=Bacillus sp. MUM 13 TaxID=1678001 RepID=UPI0008F5A81C|nr:YukJ family protein [Bacillus sp. MUM 13]OIK12869.1 hypothetical protein BIV59_07300 [Bacillus sp. MUM 13]